MAHLAWCLTANALALGPAAHTVNRSSFGSVLIQEVRLEPSDNGSFADRTFAQLKARPLTRHGSLPLSDFEDVLHQVVELLAAF